MGGKGSDKSSQQMIQMQKQEAADARAREAARQGRISSGLERIRQSFEGAPVMRNVNRSMVYGGGNTQGLPPGFSYVQQGGSGGGIAGNVARAANAARDGGASGSGNTRGFQSFSDFAQALGQGGGGGSYMVRGPDGRMYRQGEQLVYSGQEDTGQRTGGIGEDFYNKFREGILGTQLPQLAEQYGKASDETKFRHARAGTGESTAIARNIGDLVKQNTIAEGDIRQKADTATGDLRNRVNKERAAAEAQLYSTENPDVAATYATNAIRNISAETPDISPLAEAFTLASIGGANLFSGMQNAKRTNETRNALRGYGATRNVS